MSTASKPTDFGVKYGLCGHIKPQYFRWDPHNVCIGCTGMPKMDAAMRDFLFEGNPSCRFCKMVSKAVRKRWMTRFATTGIWNPGPVKLQSLTRSTKA